MVVEWEREGIPTVRGDRKVFGDFLPARLSAVGVIYDEQKKTNVLVAAASLLDGLHALRTGDGC